MKIVNIVGGLGNQMFQYAFALYLSKEFPSDDVFVDTSHTNYFFVKRIGAANLHNGYELDMAFPHLRVRKASWIQLLKVTWPLPNYWLSRIVRRLLPHRDSEYVQPVDCFFTQDRCAVSKQYGYYEGQWECVQYYLPIRQLLISSFVHGKADERNQSYIDTIKKENSVGIHVRRGDYLQSGVFGGICDIDYYQRGIKEIIKDGETHSFYIFSNDKKWCDENIFPLLKPFKVVFVTGNSGNKSCWDMFLMTYCKDLIIANSSFSWWGAFLNQREGRIIAPQKWINRDVECDIWLENWIKI